MPDYIVAELANAKKEAEKYRLQAECYKQKAAEYQTKFRYFLNHYKKILLENNELHREIDGF